MQKKITIMAIEEDISKFFKKELEKIFGKMFEIDYRHMEMEPIPPIYNTDLILYTDPEILNKLIDIVECNAPTLMMKRTITRKALRKIKEIPAGKKALVANINQYMANETMALIYQLGITEIELYPYYEGKKNYPAGIDYIIIPETDPYDFLTDIEAENILIGNRVFDISNILDIISILHVEDEKTEEIVKKYLLKVPTFWYGFEYAWQNRRVLLRQWKLLLDELSSGVVVTDSEGQIELMNNKAEEILQLENDLNKDEKVEKVITEEEKTDELIKIQGKEIVITVRNVEYEGDFYGKIILIRPYNEMVKVQQKIHKKIVGKGHRSNYHFSDLIGKDPRFNEAKEISQKISLSDSTVLLLGESGTGKEMFAGAIHNYSHRSNNPFVAVNCATLPENLLESELFGYEEGAFTGAKKGGKIGLFEQADGGTLFLDEIGDLPLQLQARLLRALEEKEIMRVGGNSVISVNVRIIAATNKELIKRVEKGEFRTDLFYRLNVFQIKLPGLAERKEDIPLLVNHFLKNWGEKRKILRDFKIFYKNYNWPGNIRELKNVLEYMTTISQGPLSFDKLPSYLKKEKYYTEKPFARRMLLLKTLYYRCQNNKSTGRRSLTKAFNKNYYDISEMEVRKMIKTLAEGKYLEINKGRAGNEITEKGITALRKDDFLADIKIMR